MSAGAPQLTQRPDPYVVPGVGRDAAGDAGPETPEMLAAVGQEALLINLDASLRVHGRPHFFSWTQGLMQNLIDHELLICALADAEPLSFTVDCFAMNVREPEMFSEAFLRDTALARELVKAWEARRFRPIVCELDELTALAGANFGRELTRIGATRLVVHGTYNRDGRAESLFIFACKPRADPQRQSYVAQLIVPCLHTAYIRTRMNERAGRGDAKKPAKTASITAREQEILGWIYRGKSNFEIGAILEISPLTVKNHVQKILRKLNVVNRAQAVGKALELRILNI